MCLHDREMPRKGKEMLRIQWLGLLGLGLPITACALDTEGGDVAQKQQDIRNGTIDASDEWRDATVRISNGIGPCTGQLVTPELVLLASHCIQGGGSLSSCTNNAQCTNSNESCVAGQCQVTINGTWANAVVDIGPDQNNPLITKNVVGWVTRDDGPTAAGVASERQLDLMFLAIDSLTPAEMADVYPYRPEAPSAVQSSEAATAVGYGAQNITLNAAGSAWVTTASTDRRFQTWGFGSEATFSMTSVDAIQYSIDVASYDSTLAGDSGGPLFRLLDETDLSMREQIGVISGGTLPTSGQATSVWANLADPDVWEWIEQAATEDIFDFAPGDPDGKWYGERDYTGPCRTDVDPDCDRNTVKNAACYQPFVEGSVMHNPRGMGATDSDVAVYGTDRVRLNDRAVVKYGSGGRADIASGGAMRIGADAKLGRATAVGPVVVNHRAEADGVLSSTKKVANYAGVPIIEGQARPAPLKDADWYISGTQDVILEPGESMTLSPYTLLDNVTVKSDAELVLQPGAYYFSSLQLEPGANLRIELGESTTVYLTGTLNHKGSIVGGSASDFTVVSNTPNTVFLESSFRGTVVAPRGMINLGSVPHTGAFFGARVEVHQAATIYHQRAVCNF